MQMDEITEEMGIDLQTESLLVRGEQLARLESDKLVDKVQRRGEVEYFSIFARTRCTEIRDSRPDPKRKSL